MVPFGAVLILLVIFGSIVTLILGAVYMKNKNRERMAILAKGVDPSMFKDDFKMSKNTSLKLGILFISIAIGIIVGYFVECNYFVPEGVAYFSCIFLFGGLGVLTGAIIDKVSEKNKPQ
jgi:hypothetical protein